MAQLIDTSIDGALEVYGNASIDNNIFLSNESYIAGKTTDGTILGALTPVTADGHCLLGYGGYASDIGATQIYGKDVKVTSTAAGLTNRSYGVNKVLWSGASYMSGSQTQTLSEAISAQPHGVVLVFSNYDSTDKVVNNYNWNCVFIPKYVVATHGGAGHDCILSSAATLYHKYLYISDTSIKGYDKNSSASASFHGQTVANTYFVMRYVIGV